MGLVRGFSGLGDNEVIILTTWTAHKKFYNFLDHENEQGNQKEVLYFMLSVVLILTRKAFRPSQCYS